MNQNLNEEILMNESVQNYHNTLRHNFLKTYNTENKTIKNKPLPLLLFHVKSFYIGLKQHGVF